MLLPRLLLLLRLLLQAFMDCGVKGEKGDGDYKDCIPLVSARRRPAAAASTPCFDSLAAAWTAAGCRGMARHSAWASRRRCSLGVQHGGGP